MEAFRYLEGVALADAAFEAEGTTLEELFQASARAVTEVMVDPSALLPSEEHTVRLQADTLERLLFSWLNELVYLKDAEAFLLKEAKVRLWRDGGERLEATLIGERIDPDRHALRSDVKAVTYHLFEVKQERERWVARVVLDI